MKAAELLTLNPTDQYPSVFHHVLSKEECIYAEDIDSYISDIDILTENRNIKDIVMVTDTYARIIKHLRNGVPTKMFNGDKKDYSMVALLRYLKGFIRCKDVRDKIQQDFKTIDIL
jgi:TFIIF-interacting CTD phosphatase-like protein